MNQSNRIADWFGRLPPNLQQGSAIRGIPDGEGPLAERLSKARSMFSGPLAPLGTLIAYYLVNSSKDSTRNFRYVSDTLSRFARRLGRDAGAIATLSYIYFFILPTVGISIPTIALTAGISAFTGLATGNLVSIPAKVLSSTLIESQNGFLKILEKIPILNIPIIKRTIATALSLPALPLNLLMKTGKGMFDISKFLFNSAFGFIGKVGDFVYKPLENYTPKWINTLRGWIGSKKDKNKEK